VLGTMHAQKYLELLLNRKWEFITHLANQGNEERSFQTKYGIRFTKIFNPTNEPIDITHGEKLRTVLSKLIYALSDSFPESIFIGCGFL
jgi:hypothetical protein